MEFANNLRGMLDILPPAGSKNEKLAEMTELMKAEVNLGVMDIAFAGEPNACTPKVCDILRDTYPWREFQSKKEAGNYKYVIDVSISSVPS